MTDNVYTVASSRVFHRLRSCIGLAAADRGYEPARYPEHVRAITEATAVSDQHYWGRRRPCRICGGER